MAHLRACNDSLLVRAQPLSFVSYNSTMILYVIWQCMHVH